MTGSLAGGVTEHVLIFSRTCSVFAVYRCRYPLLNVLQSLVYLTMMALIMSSISLALFYLPLAEASGQISRSSTEIKENMMINEARSQPEYKIMDHVSDAISSSFLKEKDRKAANGTTKVIPIQELSLKDDLHLHNYHNKSLNFDAEMGKQDHHDDINKL